MTSDSDTDGMPYIAEPDDSRYDGTLRTFFLPVLGLSCYSLPALVLLSPTFTPSTWSPAGRFGLTFLAPAVGCFAFLGLGAFSGGQDTPSALWPNVHSVPEADSDLTGEALLTEYVQVSEEARYRDKLLLRTSHLSLLTFAALMNLYFTVAPAQRPGIAALGSIVSLAFAVAVNSYKDARDPLWERQRRIELSAAFEGVLTSFHTIRTKGKRRGFDRLSLSGYIMNLQVLFLLIWMFVYFSTVLETVFPDRTGLVEIVSLIT